MLTYSSEELMNLEYDRVPNGIAGETSPVVTPATASLVRARNYSHVQNEYREVEY